MRLSQIGVGTQPSSSERVYFRAGDEVTVENVIYNQPIPVYAVDFACCGNDQVCTGPQAPLAITGGGKTTLSSNDTRAAVVVSKYRGTIFLFCIGSCGEASELATKCMDSAKKCLANATTCSCQ